MPDPSVQELIRQEAIRQQIDPAIALGVADQESGFNPTAINPTAVKGEHATGTFQFLPSVAKARGIDPTDVRQNISGGVAYLKELLDQHQGNLDAVLRTYGGVRTDQTYVPAVMAKIQKYKGQGGTDSTPAASAGMTTPPPAPKGWGQTALDLGKSAISAFDPRTPEGRRMLAGAVGAAGLTAVAPELELPVLGARVMAAAVPAAGAYLGGATEAAGEQLAQGQTPDVETAKGAGREQAGLEIGGQALAWPLKVVGRRVFSSGISKKVASGLEDLRTGIGNQLEDTLAAGQQAVTAMKQRTGAALQTAKDTAAQQIAAARARLGMAAPAVTPTQTGRMTAAAIQGPAKTALDQIGQSVEAAAESGPAVSTAPLRARLEELRAQITPAISHTQEAIPGLEGYSPAQLAQIEAKNPGTLQAVRAGQHAYAQDVGLGAPLPADHPLPGVLNKVDTILGDHPEIPFSDAHKIKRMLDDTVNWDARASKQVGQLTKGFRQTLRSEMTGHAPYDQATAAYEQAVKLHTKGIAPRLLRQAQDNPSALIDLVKAKEPVRAQMLKDLLLKEAPAGGGAQEGEAAWRAVQASWTHEKLIKGDPGKLLDRVQSLDPDFVKVMYGDPQGSAVLQNLTQIGQAIQKVTTQGPQDIAAQKAAGTAAVQGAQAAVDAAKTAAKPIERGVQDVSKQFSKSSLGRPNAVSPEELGSTVLHAAMFPHSPFTPIRISRALLRGAKVDDLIYWSALTPGRTQFLIKHVLTGPDPGMGLANMARWVESSMQEGQAPDQAVPSHTPTPPPAPRR